MHTLIYYIPTTASHLSSPPSPYLTTSPLPKIHSSSFPFRNGQTSQGFQLLIYIMVV